MKYPISWKRYLALAEDSRFDPRHLERKAKLTRHQLDDIEKNGAGHLEEEDVKRLAQALRRKPEWVAAMLHPDKKSVTRSTPYLVWSHKIPRSSGRAYVLEQDVLKGALTRAEINIVRYVSFNQNLDSPLLQARYYARTSYSGKVYSEGASVIVGTISKDRVAAVRLLVQRVALPALVRWLVRAQNAPDTWKDLNHEITFEPSGDRIRHREE